MTEEKEPKRERFMARKLAMGGLIVGLLVAAPLAWAEPLYASIPEVVKQWLTVPLGLIVVAGVAWVLKIALDKALPPGSGPLE